MPRYKEKPREDREYRKDRRAHDRKHEGHSRDSNGSVPIRRERQHRPTLDSGRNKRNIRNDRNAGYSRNDRNEKNGDRKHSYPDRDTQNKPSPEWGCKKPKEEPEKPPAEKEKPNFALSGKLTEDTNTVNGVVIKYSEPQDARKPKRRWRLYPFKGEKTLPTLYVHRQSAYLMGRDRKIADIPLDHPSCSKQHAVLQYRLVSFKREGGGEGKRLRPYLIDLESANGTYVNNVKLEPKRFHELLERDVLKFGFSSREYVLLHEQSRDDALDDDVPNLVTDDTKT